MECRAANSVKPDREDASAGLRIWRMLSLKRAGEEGSATPPSDPSCPVPNTKGLPHLQGGETIAGFEDPSSRAIIPPLGRRPAVDRLLSGAERLKVCKSVDPSRQRSCVAERDLWILANRINRSDSHVPQPQDAPKWVKHSPSGDLINVSSWALRRTKLFGPRSANCRPSRLLVGYP